MNSRWLKGFVASTAGRYLLAMIATYIAAKLGLDPIEGKATVESILVQGIGVVAMAWGTKESAMDKVSVGGEKTKMTDLPEALQEEIKREVKK